MAALSITATQVLPDTSDGIDTQHGVAAVAITAGQVVYYDASAGTVKLFDADLAAANTGAPRVAVVGAAAGQIVSHQGPGALVTIGAGAAPVQGTVYVAGSTAGAINPTSDLATTWKVAIIGVGAGSNKIKLICSNSGYSVP